MRRRLYVSVTAKVVVAQLLSAGWLGVRRNAVGFVGFVLAYQMLMSPVAVVGYGQELLGLRRRWK